MSFLNNTRPDKMPGAINNLNGICEKICIHGKKVFDACLKQEHLDNVELNLFDLTPSSTPVEPYTYLSSKTVSSRAKISDLVITPIDNNGNCYRVQCDITIPVEVLFRDANGVIYKGYSSILVSRDVKMNMPRASIMPFTVEASANIIGNSGEYISGTTFSVSLCLTTVLRVVTECDVLVPSYGYCCIPSCVDYKEEVCEGIFDLPLFPQDNRR